MIATTRSHNAIAVDIDGDGKPDIVGQKGDKNSVKKALSKSMFLCYSVSVQKGRGFGSNQELVFSIAVDTPT